MGKDMSDGSPDQTPTPMATPTPTPTPTPKTDTAVPQNPPKYSPTELPILSYENVCYVNGNEHLIGKGLESKEEALRMQRDPDGVNEEIKIQFEGLFPEPEGTQTLGPVWTASSRIFTASKTSCYVFLSTLLAIPLALAWGIVFACVNFVRIWVFSPTFRCVDLLLRPVAKVFSDYMKWFVSPVFRSCGEMFRGLRVQKPSEE